ncbi:beta/gamma crystallin domain-containing protein 2 isoform X2 [Paroedura picta]
MEKVTSSSHTFQGRAGGPITSSSFSWKKAAPNHPREEVKSPLSKVTAKSHVTEKGVPRASSPSRVSVLLEAWEKGLVGMEPSAQPASAATRRSRSPVHTKCPLSSRDASPSLSVANTKSSVSLADSRRSLSPADRRQFPIQADIKQSFSPADTKRCVSPADTKRCISPADTKRCISPADTKQSRSPTDTRRSPLLADTKRSFSLGDIKRSLSPADTQPSPSPADARRFFSLADAKRCLSPTDVRKSPSPVDAKRSFSPADTRESCSSSDLRQSPSPVEMRRSLSPLDTRRSCSPSRTRQSHSASDSRHSVSPVENRQSCFVPYRRSPSPSAGSQHSSSPVDKQRSSSFADPQSSSLPDIRKAASSQGARHSSSVKEIKQRFSSTDSRQPCSPVDVKSFSSPDSRSLSPTSDGKRSRSLSPRREFATHGPVFSQVYFPGSKPKNREGTEVQDTGSPGTARSQGENHGCGTANATTAARLPKENHTSKTVESQKDNLPTSVSARVAQFQSESCVPNTPGIVNGSLKGSHVGRTTIVKSQTESYLSRAANTTLSTKSSSGSQVAKPVARFLGSSSVSESQTQWYNSKGGSTVVFRSEREVVVPKGESGTVYRADEEVIVSNSGPGRMRKSQQQRGLKPNTADNTAPRENNHQPKDDHSDAKSPTLSLSPTAGACNNSLTEPPPQSCMTQPRSTGVNDAQRERCMLEPSPAITSKKDATTCGEGAVHFSTPQSDCSIHNKAVFQKHSNPVAASKSEKVGSMLHSGCPKARGSNGERYLSRGEKVTTSGFKISWCTSGGGTAEESSMPVTLLGSQKTAPEDQKVATQIELKKEWSDSSNESLVFPQGPEVHFVELDSSRKPLTQETGRNDTTTEEEPEESVDMELFVDTLRNMEPPELRKPLKIHPRLPRPSTLAKQAALPPIHEYRITPKSQVPLPAALGELFALTEERNSEKEDNGFAEDTEEVENPYLTEDEKSQASNQDKKPYPWENKSYKTEEEIGAFLGKLQQASVEYKVINPKSIGNQSNFIRANILKGASLLCDFVEKKAVEDKPYSRLDNSFLYSKFITPEKTQFKAPEKGKDGSSSPMVPVILQVNRECQTSPNGPQFGSKEHLGSEPSLAGFQVHCSSRTPSAKIGCSQATLLSKEVRCPPQTPSCLDIPPKDDRDLKINLRPGKIILYSQADFGGEKREIWCDIIDATAWELSHTISVRVIRGGWVMYEKPRFHGRKCVLSEGDVEITNPWKMYQNEGEAAKNTPFRIGSLKRVVRDYRIPEISLFMEENGEGPKQRFTDSSEDLRTHGRPLKTVSIIVHSGLWLVYLKPFFDDDPYVLEPGGYPTLQAWGAKDPYVCSLHPIKLGCPVVEKPREPKVMIYEKPHFQGHCWEVSRDIYDLKKLENSEDFQMAAMGSLKIMGGCWVGYEKEGFRGHQYLLEEGEYLDWPQWGGYNKQLVSLRLIRTDFLDPALMLFEAMDFENGASVELFEALPDVELAGYGPTTQSIHVLSGVWVAYEDKNFSGEQYILEKGVYRNCEDWGASNCRISSVQPILQVGEHSLQYISVIQLFSGPEFSGAQMTFNEDQSTLPDVFIPRSCRVYGGSWILYDSHHFEGEQHVISEGEYPTLTSMGCLSATAICSLKKVPLFFSDPSIFLHGLECFEGKEIELNSEVRSLQAEGFNNHVLSVRVKGGIWVLCEHSDFRGRQWMLDCMEITNWLTYSGLQHVGSLYPIRQRRVYFRMKNGELKSFLSVPDDVEDMKAGRVLVSELNDRSSSIWYYEEGLLKNQVAPGMSLQVIGPAKRGAKVVLWSETRVPRQTWRIDSFGRVCSQMFDNMIVDVKGGQTYDRDHAILWDSFDEKPTQIWDVQVL